MKTIVVNCAIQILLLVISCFAVKAQATAQTPDTFVKDNCS
jgi:hypothetical protein